MGNRVVTASAYVIVQGLFVFQVGQTRAGDRLGVVRLGGHVEPGESSLACAWPLLPGDTTKWRRW